MRKAKPKKRILLPDPKFGDVSVTRFVNNLMLDGKKSIAYTIFYDALELVRPERKISISMKNLVLYSRKRAGKTMADRLSAEIMDAFNQQGAAFKRKEEMHRMAEANKAFAHFRF